jgi:pyruvate dehydrogenase E2 component (dihydrolipoamide acetyltransferase)
VGGLLAYVVQPGESVAFENPTPSLSPAASLTGREEERSAETLKTASGAHSVSTPTQANGSAMPTISPRARRIAHELGVDWTRLTGSGRTGRIVERDVRAALEGQPAPVEVSPVARRAAQELGVDLAALGAQMPGKRITREDVERAAENPLEHPTPSPNSARGEKQREAAFDSSPADKRLPVSRVRQVIAERMAASSQTTAAVTLTTEVDATELVKLRQQLKNDTQAPGKVTPTYNDLLMKLTASALQEHPALNARFEGDALVQSAAAHIGLAVDTERGLLVAVVRHVPDKTLRQIAVESASLIERARAGTLKADELSGSTFSLSNLGMYDIDAFTPIINLPECAILGIGRITPKVVVIDVDAERTAIRQMMFLSLTFDHRLVDGAPAARFLQRIKQFIEQPYLWLVG